MSFKVYFVFLVLVFSLVPCVAAVDLVDKNGRTIQADVLELNADALTVRRSDGRRFTFPISLLSEASQQLVRDALNDGTPNDSPSRMPEFSWDTLPLYIHIRKVDAFNDQELNYLAGFPLITLEKTTGSRAYGSTDEGTIEAAKAIKQINPAAKVLFYRNVIVHYGTYSFDEQLADIPNWYLVDKRGNDQLIRGNSRAYDTSTPELRNWWVATAAEVCKSPYVDGLFLDGNIKVLTSFLVRQLPANKKQQTIDGYHEMMTETRKALGPEKLMLANIIRGRFTDGGLEFMDYFDGSYLECFTTPAGTRLSKADYLVKGIDATQKAARQGKIIAMTLGLGESSVSDDVDELHTRIDDISEIRQDELNFKLALFLVCAEKYSYLFLNDGYCVDTRGKNEVCQSGLWLKSLPEYKKPLGAPKGPANQQGYLYTREFEHASVWLDLDNSVGKIRWD
ncbi:putative glycoside hydrolase [Aporhodopirellula aestuarii]|uniref:Glycoside hydrolase family 15 protein n=1 Tax=Aporhodopirellula aestuarii TaxID=2950107 RepID=A0ABT0U059_9BACT|nr:putative glycoside hydrolase [Aporhodopirellula aestuarii]MCM2370237.1 putative glycoside hydrolase family 15 protein [Aporhodopirellula aestuarii]